MTDNKEITDLLAEAVRLEMNIGKLYVRFHQSLPDDGAFWWQLAMEEKNHASLLRSADQIASVVHDFPAGLLPEQLQEIRELNARIEARIVAEAAAPSTRNAAFGFALELEQSSGELHFQTFMETVSTGQLSRIFQSLNRGDMDHAQRLRTYMQERGIS